MPITTAQLEKLHPYKELLVTSSVILTCLILSVIFPATNSFQSVSRNLFFLIVLPVLYIKLILKRDPTEYGWKAGNMKNGLFSAAFALFLGLAVFYLLIRFAGFSSHYHINSLIKNSFGLFLLYELVFLNIFFFAQEFFFKSFVLFSYRQFSYWAVLIQSGIYFSLLVLTKNFSWQTLPVIFVSLVGGFITFKTKSFLYSYIFGLLFIMILDAYIIHLVR
ncbi:MAG: hypothetical protein WC022_01650 [Parcubacteria group bacterium]